MFRSVNQARVKALVLSFSNTLYAPRARARAHAPWFTFTTHHSTQQPLLNHTSLHSFYILPFIPHPCIHSKMLPFTTTCRILLSYSFIHFDIPSLDLNFRMRSHITSFILTPRRACERWSRHARARELPHLGSLTQFAIHPNSGIESDTPPFTPHSPMHPTSLHSSKNASIYNHMLLFTFIFFHTLPHSSFDVNLRIRSNITSFILTPRRARERWSRHARARAPSPRFTYTVCHSPQQPLLNPIFLHSFYTPPCMPHPFIHPRMFPFTNVCIRLLLYSFNTSTLLHSTWICVFVPTSLHSF